MNRPGPSRPPTVQPSQSFSQLLRGPAAVGEVCRRRSGLRGVRPGAGGGREAWPGGKRKAGPRIGGARRVREEEWACEAICAAGSIHRDLHDGRVGMGVRCSRRWSLRAVKRGCGEAHGVAVQRRCRSRWERAGPGRERSRPRVRSESSGRERPRDHVVPRTRSVAELPRPDPVHRLKSFPQLLPGSGTRQLSAVVSAVGA